MKNFPSYLLGLDILGAVPGAARSVRPASTDTSAPGPSAVAEAAKAAGQNAVATANKIASRLPRLSRKLMSIGNKVLIRAGALSAAAAKAAATRVAPTVPTPTRAMSSRSAASAAFRAPTQRPAVRTSVRTTAVRGDVSSSITSDYSMTALVNVLTAVSNNAYAIQDRVMQLNNTGQTAAANGGQQLMDRVTSLLSNYDPDQPYDASQRQTADSLQADETAWLAQAAVASASSSAATSPLSSGGGGGGGGGSDSGSSDGGASGGGGDDGGGDGSGDFSAMTTDPEVAKFRESGGNYDPFADDGNGGNADGADPFADSAYADPNATDASLDSGDLTSDVASAQQLATVLGLDFKWQYIFMPHLAIQDALADKSTPPTDTWVPPPVVAPPPQFASPAARRKLILAKKKLADTLKQIDALKKQQAVSDAFTPAQTSAQSADQSTVTTEEK